MQRKEGRGKLAELFNFRQASFTCEKFQIQKVRTNCDRESLVLWRMVETSAYWINQSVTPELAN